METTTKSALGQGLCLTYGHLFNEYGCCKDCGKKEAPATMPCACGAKMVNPMSGLHSHAVISCLGG